MGGDRSAGSREPGDAELLALLLRAGRGSGLAERLLARFGSLRQLLHADSASILAENGLGAARLAVLRALPLLAGATEPIGGDLRTGSSTSSLGTR